jgi:hypothetical protein
MEGKDRPGEFLPRDEPDFHGATQAPNFKPSIWSSIDLAGEAMNLEGPFLAHDQVPGVLDCPLSRAMTPRA